jgi:hypothetical protein
VIVWRYYLNDIKSLLSQKRQRLAPRSNNDSDTDPGPDSTDQINNENKEDMPARDEALLEKQRELLSYLTDQIREAHQKNYTKQDLIQMLEMILKEYPAPKGSSFQLAVNGRIDAECAKYGSIYLSEGDKNQVWDMI